MTTPDKPRRVLIVEDEALVAMLLEDMVTDLGHEVVATAGRMERAMELARTLALDLAIVDVNLNGEHTYPLAAVLAERGIPFVFATGYGAGGIKEEWKHAAVLQKPIQTRDLAIAVAQAMRQSAGART